MKDHDMEAFDNTPTAYLDSSSLKNMTIANPKQRLTAAFIDLLIVVLVAYLLPVIGPILSVSYYLTKDALPFLNRQSLGKGFVGIKVIDKDTGQPINYSASILRSVTLTIPLFNIIDALAIFSSGSSRLGDKWANTMVIK